MVAPERWRAANAVRLTMSFGGGQKWVGHRQKVMDEGGIADAALRSHQRHIRIEQEHAVDMTAMRAQLRDVERGSKRW